MNEIKRIAGTIQSIGFECTRCGTCCSGVEPDSNLVMVTPSEIREIMVGCGFSWQEIAEPYPEQISDGKDHTYTIGWCIHRYQGNCRFLENSACRIYKNRPWICRTYPFVLEGNTVRTYPCPGLGRRISRKDAMTIAKNLRDRKKAEEADEAKIRSVLQNGVIPTGIFVVIDSEGMKEVLR